MSNDITISSELTSAGIDLNDVTELVLKMDEQVKTCDALTEELAVTDEALKGMDREDVKRLKQSISSTLRDANEARREFKRRWQQPQQAVEKAFKAAIVPLEELEGRYKAEIDSRDDAIRLERYTALEGAYQEAAPALAPVIPFGQLLACKGLESLSRDRISVAKGWSQGKAEDMVLQAASDASRDWKALQGSRLDFPEETEAVFFRTLSLRQALDHDAMRAEEQARIDALKAEVMPEEPDRVPVDAYTETEDPGERYTATFEVSGLSLAGVEALKGLLRENGYHGRMTMRKEDE